jgi:hypothetical protein
MNYTIYNPANGQILELYSTSDSAETSLVLTNSCHVQGFYDSNLYYIEQGQPCLKAPKPTDSIYYFDYTTKTWQKDLDQLTIAVREQRNVFLNAVDKINPTWYASLTVEQQQQLQAYRAALLDIPQQAGFPESVEWPAKPTWL